MLAEPEPQAKRPKKRPPWNASGRYVAAPDVVGRVRSVIRYAKIRQQMLLDGKEPAFMRDKPSEMKFWKDVFDRYDVDNSGALDFQEVTEIIREDLKIGERTLTKLDLRDFYSHLDQNDDQMVDWHEWLDFVSQGKLRDTRPIDQVMGEVGRAVRLSLRRLGLRPQQVEEHVRGLSEVVEPIDVTGFMRIFRKGMRIDRHDCCDDNLRRTFGSIADGAPSVKLQVVIDFLTLSCLAKTNKEIGMGTTFPGLLGGIRGHLPSRMPRNRPGTFPMGGTVSGPTWGPFALNGRRLPPCNRLAVGRQPMERQPLRPTVSCPDLPNNVDFVSERTLALMEAAEEPKEEPKAQNRVDRTKFLSNMSNSSQTERERPLSSSSYTKLGVDVKDKVLSDPFAVFLKMNAQSEKKEVQARKPNAAKKPGREPLRESYSIIVGKDALNRVERQLYEAGVDMRGAYHRTG